MTNIQRITQLLEATSRMPLESAVASRERALAEFTRTLRLDMPMGEKTEAAVRAYADALESEINSFWKEVP